MNVLKSQNGFPFSVMLPCTLGGIGMEEMVVAHWVQGVERWTGFSRFESAGATDWMGGCSPLSP